MTILLSDLVVPKTSAEVQADIYAELLVRGIATTGWKPGAVVRTIVAVVSIVIAALWSVVSLLAASGFRRLAIEDWATLVARYTYDVERNAATFAQGTVTLTNASGAIYDLDPGDLIVAHVTTGQTYTNTSAVHIGASSVASAIVRAVEAGSNSTATAGTITVLVTSLNGVTCTNSTALVGIDAETDDALWVRCDAKLAALSPNGAADAYRYVALQSTDADGVTLGITRTRVIGDSATGTVLVAVATASGAVAGTEGDPSTPLGACAKAIWEQCTPVAVTSTVQSAVPYTLTMTYTAWIYTGSGMTAANVAAAIDAALVAFLAKEPIGGHIKTAAPGYLYLTALKAAMMSISPYMIDVVISVPAADVVLGTVAVPTLGTTTWFVDLVVGP